MNNPRTLTLSAIFIALAVAGGMALIQIPNVEVITVTIFLSGFLLGVPAGIAVGAGAEFLYSFFNPYGVALPPLLIAQVFSMALAGAAGGVLRRVHPGQVPHPAVLGVLGLMLTASFDLMTTYAGAWMIGQQSLGFLALLLAGFSFYATHLLTNTLIFALVLPILVRRMLTLNVFDNSAFPAKVDISLGVSMRQLQETREFDRDP